MMPGVMYLPVPSTTTASDGAVRFAPTAAIFPSRSSTDAFEIVGPAAVITVAFRISVVRDGNGRYVLGNGSAFGAETPPRPGPNLPGCGDSCRTGAGAVAPGAGADCA